MKCNTIDNSEMKKLQKIMKETVAYHNKFVSENPDFLTESVDIKKDKDIIKLQKIMKETMAYHNKFISENPYTTSEKFDEIKHQQENLLEIRRTLFK